MSTTQAYSEDDYSASLRQYAFADIERHESLDGNREGRGEGLFVLLACASDAT